MGNPNLPASHEAAIIGVIDPDAYVASTLVSVWMPMKDFHNLQAIIMAGTLGTSATLDAKLQQATSSGGAGAKDITGKAITQLTQAGGDSDKQAVINLLAEELDVDNGFNHVQLSVTIATATSDAGAVVMGHNPRYGPASDTDLTSVDEIVA